MQIRMLGAARCQKERCRTRPPERIPYSKLDFLSRPCEFKNDSKTKTVIIERMLAPARTQHWRVSEEAESRRTYRILSFFAFVFFVDRAA